MLLTTFIFLLSSINISAAPKVGNTSNIAPTIDLNVTPAKKPVDIVILTDYTGTKLSALNTQINALKAQFTSVNVDPVFHIINSVKKVGTQEDELYMYRRYGRFFYTVSSYRYYRDYGLEQEYIPHTLEETILWEEAQGLRKTPESLPKRNPTNVRFTKSSKIVDMGKPNVTDRHREYYDVTIRCNNDVKTSGMVQEEIYYKNYEAARERVYGVIQAEWAVVDNEWTREEKISDVSYDVFSLDFSKLNTVPLRAGSDRHMIFLSDAAAKDYSKELGNYFSFGDLTDTVKTYIKTNNFSLYGVAPEDARYKTLLPDKVQEILPLTGITHAYGGMTLYYMQNGKILKPEIIFGDTLYREFTENIGDVKEKIKLSHIVYLHMQDGTIKYFDSAESKIKTVEGIANVKKIYNFNNSSMLYVLDNNGKIYLMYGPTEVIPFNNSVVISDIYRVSRNTNIYVTSTGVPYMEYRTWNRTTGVTKEYMLTRAKIQDINGTVRNLPNIKGAAAFVANGPGNYYQRPSLVLYTTGQIQQFEDVIEDVDTSTNIWTYISYLEENSSISILETDVKAIDHNDVCIFIFKNDGTIKMLGAYWIEGTYYDDDDRKRTGLLPHMSSTTLNVPLSNIQSSFRTGIHKYIFVDSNNNTYIYDGGSQATPPVIGTTLKNLGNNIRKIERNGYTSGSSGYHNLYFLYNDGTVKLMRYLYTVSGGNYSLYTNTVLPHTEIRDISTISTHAYLLKNDGSVLYGGSSTGQNFTAQFTNPLTIDTTKTYLSLLDIFNEISSSVFYPAGGYATALTAIYNKYSSYSSGNMYVVLGDAIKYESAYDDYESDPEHIRKWVISHDPYYFDNNMGLSAYHNPAGAAANPPVKLDKVGRYTINLYARDNPKTDNRFDNYRLWSLGKHNLTVYIHRKPVAQQRVQITNNGNGTFTVKALDAGSYDLDHSNSRADKGIAAREWRWKEAASTIWTTGQMNKPDCLPDKSYITQLRVKDIEGVWSDYHTITIDKNNPPVAVFSLDKAVIKDSDLLKVKDQSFPQSFSQITNWHWVVKKLNSDGTAPSANIQNAQFTNSNAGTGALAGYDSNVKTSYGANGAGTYRLYLRVKDGNGLWSDGETNSVTPVDLSKYHSMDFVVDKAPTPSFTVENSVIKAADLLKVTETSTTTGVSAVTRWHWIVKKLNANGTVPSTNLQSAIFTTHNSGTGAMAGYDTNVITNYSAYGTGTYRIYLRACNGNGMWSDGGSDTSFNPGSFAYRDIVVDAPPTAGFTIAQNPIAPTDLLKLRDTSAITGVSEIDRWHWIVKKLDGAGGVPGTLLQDDRYTNSNTGTGALAGYDSNVMTDYSACGPGTYRIYLRVRNASGMWSDGGTDTAIRLEGLFYRDLLVQESYKISNFRVVKVKDLHLESYYYNPSTGQYDDRPMDVNSMAVDRYNFGEMVDGLTKGYMFEFEIDTVNFNNSNDSIIITPHFYTCGNYGRDQEERDLYWENSYHEILKAGEGGHEAWSTIRLGAENRTIKGDNKATWRGSYLIPGTAWAVLRGTTAGNAVSGRLERDIIVAFEIKGYNGAIMRYDYNLKQWPVERTNVKQPYEIGDVIRYSYKKCNLDDNNVILNRP